MEDEEILYQNLLFFRDHCPVIRQPKNCAFNLIDREDQFRLWYHRKELACVCHDCDLKPEQLKPPKFDQIDLHCKERMEINYFLALPSGKKKTS